MIRVLTAAQLAAWNATPHPRPTPTVESRRDDSTDAIGALATD